VPNIRLFDAADTIGGPVLPEEAGIPFGDGTIWAMSKSFQLLERLTGTPLTAADLTFPGTEVGMVMQYR